MKPCVPLLLAFSLWPVVAMAKPVAAPAFDDASALSRAMAQGAITSEAAVKQYLARIDALNHKGPRLNAVIAVNPDALAQARRLDAERKAGHVRGPLHGVPVLLKDNIEARGMPTTAGSLALARNAPDRDAAVVAALVAAGAVILGKTNLSESANIRSSRSMGGWSAVGGLTRNPYALDRTACGSSSGSGAAVAAGLAPLAVGTETDGSVVCPSSVNGLVGLKPTIGLVPRTGIIPISHSQDTAGPMGRSVRDVAVLLSGMIASDSRDPTTRDASAHRRAYGEGLSIEALHGVRIGVIRKGDHPGTRALFDHALAALRSAGAILVDVKEPEQKDLEKDEIEVLLCELKSDLGAYLATTSPDQVETRTLADLIAFDASHAAEEMPIFGQELFERAQATRGLGDPGYVAARARSLAQAREGGIDKMLRDNHVDLLVTPTYGPAWLSDTVYGDTYPDASASTLPAIAGYPHLTVPMGEVRGLPVGLSFIGTAYSEAKLLQAGYAFEQAMKLRLSPTYLPTVDVGAALEPSAGAVR